jgi:hypothetical protein
LLDIFHFFFVKHRTRVNSFHFVIFGIIYQLIVELKSFLLCFLLAVPFSGISYQVEKANVKSAKTYANHDDLPVSHFSFVGQDVPQNSKGQTFLSKRDPKAINTGGRIIAEDSGSIINSILFDEGNPVAPRQSANSQHFIDRFLRSSISPQAP